MRRSRTAYLSLYALKPGFGVILCPLTRRLAAAGVVPNQVTVAAILLSLAMGTLLALAADQRWPLMLLPAILAIRMILNAINGELARFQQSQSVTGSFLNECEVLISDSALYLPLVLVPAIPTNILSLVIVLTLIGESVGIASSRSGMIRRHQPLLTKPDRALAMGSIAFFIGTGGAAGLWLQLVFGGMAVLLAANVATDVWCTLREGNRR